MKTSDFYYKLPEELIAQDPLLDRSASRLLCLQKENGSIVHDHFANIVSYLREGDCLVLNNTKVIPARLFGTRVPDAAIIELLLLKRLDKDSWETLVKPGKKAKVGVKIVFGDGIVEGTITQVLDNGNRVITFSYQGVFEEILEQLGEMPLPPYIHHKLEDQSRYQTVFARHAGSAAAPTAGLHFTEALLAQVQEAGISVVYVTLHVGIGTFRPVKVEDVHNHSMHTETYEVLPQAADTINETKQRGGRIVCVGTTSCRTLESAAVNGVVVPGCGDTDIFIYPGYRFQVLDALITNFHLPESTLLMLVSALAGKESVMNAYEEAIREKYRFFSFGDAMLIC